MFAQIKATKEMRKSSGSRRIHTEKAANSVKHIWPQRFDVPGWELQNKKTIQMRRLKDADGQEMEMFDTENLLLFQQALNVLYMTRKNPIVFVSKMIKQLKKAEDSGCAEALQMCKAARHNLIRTHGGFNIDAAETIVDSDEFDVFIGDWDVDDDSLVNLFVQADDTASYINDCMNNMLKAQVKIDQCVSGLTRVADSVINRVFFESMLILGMPQNPVAVYAVGSFGRMELMPASDLDFGVIGLDDADKELVRNIADLMAIKVNFAREIYSRMQGFQNSSFVGFQADPLWLVCNTSIMPENVVSACLIKGTPQDARLIIQINDNDETLQNKFDIERYTKKSEEFESMLRHDAASVFDFGINISQVYNIKEKWIRPLTLIMQKLNYFYDLRKSSTIERIHALSERGILNSALTNCIVDSFRYVLQTRWKVHSHFKAENDNIAFLSSDAPDVFVLGNCELARFKIIERDFNKLFMELEKQISQ